MPILLSFVSGFQKCHFYVRQFEMPKNRLKSDVAFASFLPFHSKKDMAFEIWFACCLYVALEHIFRFLYLPKFRI